MLLRHTLAWIEVSAARRLVERAEAGVREALRTWLANNWPLCVRRGDFADRPDETGVALGLPLPPDQGKRRLRFAVGFDEVVRTDDPVPLREVIARAPDRFRTFLAALDRKANDRGLSLRVYGSFAWQALTTLNYVTEASDLDLLVAPKDGRALDAAVALLTREGTTTRLRIDGEIVFPGGDAVSWREWSDSSSRDAHVLVKRIDRVTLMPRETLRARLEAAVPA